MATVTIVDEVSRMSDIQLRIYCRNIVEVTEWDNELALKIFKDYF